jgi:2-polyprenyl-3-methyl-5-hydroxy-6-metoxy-1,4-benzoquinol methylase
MISKILKATKEQLNSIEFDSYRDSFLKKGYPNNWFFMEAGEEHYRLLAYIGSLYKSKTLLDIGSYQGNSAIALAHSGNKIISYDLASQPIISKIKKDNISFEIGNILDNNDLILSSPFIMLDTYHDGTFEQEFVDHLVKINYKGLVMFDDINLNKEMSNFWNGLKNEKYDLTHIGHHSGTGIAIF